MENFSSDQNSSENFNYIELLLNSNNLEKTID